jgi:hypothetical protein
MKLYYALYFNSPKSLSLNSKYILRIETNPNLCINESEITDEVKEYNDCYVYSSSKKAIRKYAESLKKEWELEALQNYENAKNLKIDNKYLKRK